jgi:hypothetical protein
VRREIVAPHQDPHRLTGVCSRPDAPVRVKLEE